MDDYLIGVTIFILVLFAQYKACEHIDKTEGK